MPAYAPRHTADPTASDDVVSIAFAAGDERRALLLRVLQHDSFTVSELSQLLGMAQPALSHHLKVLREAGLLSARREANSIFYRRSEASGSRLKSALFEALDGQPLPSPVNGKIERLHAERERQVERFFAGNADALKSQRVLISASKVYAPSLRELWQAQCPAHHNALEIGPGDGEILALLAGDFDHVTAIDHVDAMLEPLRSRFGRQRNIEFVRQAYTRFRTRERFDAIIAAMVLHHFTSPRALFSHTARLLGEKGVLLIAELEHHEHEWVRDACGDLWLGFDSEELDRWAGSTGLTSGPRQFLAQKNGFSIQILTYIKEQA